MNNLDEIRIPPPTTSWYNNKSTFYGVRLEKPKEKDTDEEESSDDNRRKKKYQQRNRKNYETKEEKQMREKYSRPEYQNPQSYDEHYDWYDYRKPVPTVCDIVTREVWGAEEPTSVDEVQGLPLCKVLVLYTGMEPCFTRRECCAEMRRLQQLYMGERNLTDIPWNFLIGTDGRVYEGRGWGVHPKKVNSLYKWRRLEGKSYDIAYMGPWFNVDEEKAKEKFYWPKLSFTKPMFYATMNLLKTGVKNNFIDSSFGVESSVNC